MILSHSKKFIFIHNYKVAGTSITTALNKYSYRYNFQNKLKSFLHIYPRAYSNRFKGHIKAKDLQDNLPEYIFNSYFKFGFVRNPWDWQVSLFHYARQNEKHHQHRLIRKMSFDQYIDWRVHEDLNSQKDFFFNTEGQCLVDYIGRFETLQIDFNKVCANLSLPVINLQHKKRSAHENYRKYYSQKSKKLIGQAFLKDILLFDYTF